MEHCSCVYIYMYNIIILKLILYQINISSIVTEIFQCENRLKSPNVPIFEKYFMYLHITKITSLIFDVLPMSNITLCYIDPGRKGFGRLNSIELGDVFEGSILIYHNLPEDISLS